PPPRDHRSPESRTKPGAPVGGGTKGSPRIVLDPRKTDAYACLNVPTVISSDRRGTWHDVSAVSAGCASRRRVLPRVRGQGRRSLRSVWNRERSCPPVLQEMRSAPGGHRASLPRGHTIRASRVVHARASRPTDPHLQGRP